MCFVCVCVCVCVCVSVCVCVVCVCVHVRIASHVASLLIQLHITTELQLLALEDCKDGLSRILFKIRSYSCVLIRLLHTITPYIAHSLLRHVLEEFQDGLPVIKECVCVITVRVVGNPGQRAHPSKRAQSRKMPSGKKNS